jgi:hypothetical protein
LFKLERIDENSKLSVDCQEKEEWGTTSSRVWTITIRVSFHDTALITTTKSLCIDNNPMESH